jgi:carboxypeptidase family protein
MIGIKCEIRTSRRFLQFVCFLLMLGPFALRALAAVETTLSGNITDPQGSVVAGATVRLFRRADSSRRETQTDSQGQFSFSQVDSGEYRLTVEYPGFAPVTRTIALFDGNRTENIQFSTIASQSESVTVSADVSDVGLFAPDPA